MIHSYLAHPIFKGTDPERITPILESVRPHSVPSGTVVSVPGGPPRLRLVLSGLLRAYRLSADGRQLLVEFVPSGGFDGILSVSGRPGHFTVAAEDSLILTLDPELLDQLLTCDARLSTNLLWATVQRLAVRERQLEYVSGRDSSRGLASLLLLLAERNGRVEDEHTVLELRLTHQTLADMLGVRRETVTNALPPLVAAGAVMKKGGRYVVRTELLRELVGA